MARQTVVTSCFEASKKQDEGQRTCVGCSRERHDNRRMAMQRFTSQSQRIRNGSRPSLTSTVAPQLLWRLNFS
jgi:hypothetical protein